MFPKEFSDDLKSDIGRCCLQLLTCKMVEETSSPYWKQTLSLSSYIRAGTPTVPLNNSSGAGVEVVQLTPFSYRPQCSLLRPVILQFF